MDYAIVDGMEDVEVSLGTNGRKKLAKKLGIMPVDVNKLLAAKTLAKAPPNKTKAEIEAIDAAKAKKKAPAKKTKEPKVKAPSYESVTDSFVSGVPDNSKVKKGAANKPIEQNIEIALVWNQKTTVPATTFGSVAVHRPITNPTGNEYKISEISTGNLMGGGTFSKEQAEKLARRLARLDWTNSGTTKRPQYSDETTKKAKSILGL